MNMVLPEWAVPCAVHLPGNHPCPYPAVYVTNWSWHRPDPNPQLVLKRPTCLHHLAQAIDNALENMSASDARIGVTVRLVNDSDLEATK